MESVLLKANLVNLSTGQYWLNFYGEKGMSDREGHGHWAVLYKSHFPPLRHSIVIQLLERHRCIHRLINHVYTKGTKRPFVIHCPTTLSKSTGSTAGVGWKGVIVLMWTNGWLRTKHTERRKLINLDHPPWILYTYTKRSKDVRYWSLFLHSQIANGS